MKILLIFLLLIISFIATIKIYIAVKYKKYRKNPPITLKNRYLIRRIRRER